MNLALAVFLATLASCSFKQDKMSGNSANFTESLRSFSALNSEILQPKCLRCHSGPSAGGGVNLSTYSSILANPGLVVAGSPTDSRIYTEVQTGSMPQEGPPLSSAEIQVIANWILAGAPDGDFGSSAGSGPAPPPSSPLPPPSSGTQATFKSIQSQIFAQSCVRCHSGAKPSGEVDLSSYAKLMSRSGDIVAGSPPSSLVFTEIESGSMPPRGTKVDPKLIQLLANWIQQGAKND